MWLPKKKGGGRGGNNKIYSAQLLRAFNILMYMDIVQKSFLDISFKHLIMKHFRDGTEHLTELVFLGEDFKKYWCGKPGGWAAAGIVI